MKPFAVRLFDMPGMSGQEKKPGLEKSGNYVIRGWGKVRLGLGWTSTARWVARKTLWAGLFGLWLCLAITPAFAQSGGMATDEGLEISGLILDETKTKIGRDFFEYFTSHWQEIKGIQYTITITELPSGIRGSIMRIKWNDEVVYQTILNPRPGQVEKTAKQAVLEVQIYVLRQLTTKQQLEEEFQY